MKLELKNVRKSFKDNNILENVNITMTSGHIYGFIGRNGSGKSVLLKMICAFYEPTEGEILFDGVNIIKKKSFPPNTRALIEGPNFLPDLSGEENLSLLANIQKTIGMEEIKKSLELVNLYEDKDKKYHKYSVGMKQKLGLAQVFMENPDLIILDEPFNGIEDMTTDKLRKYLIEEKEKGKLIIIATHIKEDIEKLVDELFKIDDGKIEKVKK